MARRLIIDIRRIVTARHRIPDMVETIGPGGIGIVQAVHADRLAREGIIPVTFVFQDIAIGIIACNKC